MFYFLFWAGVLALSGHSSSSSRAGQESGAGSRVDFDAAGEDGLPTELLALAPAEAARRVGWQPRCARKSATARRLVEIVDGTDAEVDYGWGSCTS